MPPTHLLQAAGTTRQVELFLNTIFRRFDSYVVGKKLFVRLSVFFLFRLTNYPSGKMRSQVENQLPPSLSQMNQNCCVTLILLEM